ncbi:MAG: hypothetical protein PHN19_04715 [Patescibacteria group bacterium]|nr:hypothetical protein [Patescibacteria group bacterium]
MITRYIERSYVSRDHAEFMRKIPELLAEIDSSILDFTAPDKKSQPNFVSQVEIKVITDLVELLIKSHTQPERDFFLSFIKDVVKSRKERKSDCDISAYEALR